MTFPTLHLLALAASLAPLAPAQATWIVDASAPPGGDGSPGLPFDSIQDAFDASASTGDTVRVLPGTYSETLLLDGKSLDCFAASGLGSVVVDGGGAGSTLWIVNAPMDSVVVRGIEFRGGSGTPDGAGVSRGGGVLIEGGTTDFESCVFTLNSAQEGGGVQLEGGDHAFSQCSFTRNEGAIGVGLCAVGAELVVVGGEVSENRSTGVGFAGLQSRGAGVALLSEGGPGSSVPGALFENVQIADNTADLGSPSGIGVFAAASTVLRGCVVEGNVPTSIGFRGGGVHGGRLEDCVVRNNGGSMSGGGGAAGVVAVRCEFRGNVAAEGGGVRGGTFEDCLFEGNIGGGLCCAEGALGGGAFQATLTRCVLRGNVVESGIPLQGAGAFDCDLTACLVENNFIGDGGWTELSNGGGLAQCTARDTVIRGNRNRQGGGAYFCTLERCLLEGNRAFRSGGGATDCQLVDCRIVGNEADLYGGGTATRCELLRCVVAGNRALRVAGVEGGTADFCTVTGNVASGQVGGVGVDSGETPGPFFSPALTVTNSIVYANHPDDAGEVTGSGIAPDLDVEWSLVGTGWPGAGNLTGDGLVAGPLSGNEILLAGSPAIDAADPTFFDPDLSRADMGARPFDAAAVPVPSSYCTAKANGQGVEPKLVPAGSPTLTGADDFELVGRDLNGASFVLVVGATEAAETPAFGGTVCVNGSVARLGVLPTGGVLGQTDGEVRLLFDQATLAGYGPGALVYAQLLVRDPQHPDGSGAALSAGLEIRVLP